MTADDDVRREARNAFAEAAMTTAVPARVRIRGFRGLGWAAMVERDGTAALAAYEEAISLLPQIAPRRLSRADREHGLGEMAGLAAEAASAAIEADQPELGVELLEQARGVLLAQVMDTRSDLTDLRATAPALAEEFELLRDELNVIDDAQTISYASARTRPRALSPSHSTGDAVTAEWTSAQGAFRALTDQRARVSEKWDNLLAAIRQTPGLQSFLKPPGIAELQRQAVAGPIVMINPSPYRCDALILTPDAARPVHVVPLPALTRNDLIDTINQLRVARGAATDGDLKDRATTQVRIHQILEWLWDQIAAPVLADLGLSGHAECETEWPRIWWCPIGEAAFLPLHAAGHHRAVGENRTVVDCVVSSYIPTIRSLAYVRLDALTSSAPPESALIVAMPETPDAPPIPGTGAEASRLARLLPDPVVVVGSQATHDVVLDALPHHQIAHLACHGLTDLADPASSRLLLHDHTTSPLTVTAVSRLHLTNAQLAYLSACNTTNTNQLLADEAVHITAAFQLAGFRNVIGTLWPILDASAATIADGVYAILTANGTAPPDTSRTAYALHECICELRNARRARPIVWAAHIHSGI